MELSEMVDKFIEDGVLTHDEHEELMDRIHADGQIDDNEKALISKIFSLIQSGELKVVDPEREQSEERRRQEIKEKLLQNN